MDISRRELGKTVGLTGAFSLAAAASPGHSRIFSSSVALQANAVNSPMASDHDLDPDDSPVGAVYFNCRNEDGADCYSSEGIGNKGGGWLALHATIQRNNTLIKKPVIELVNRCSFDIEVRLDHGAKEMFKKKSIKIKKGETKYAKIKDKQDPKEKFPKHDDTVGQAAFWYPDIHIYKGGARIDTCENSFMSEHTDIVIEC